LLKYLEISFSGRELGHPLNVSVMNAFILAGRSEEALKIFYRFLDEFMTAEEMSLGGGADRSHFYLARDLAMRALGQTNERGASDTAYELFCQVQSDQVVMSLEALCGVIRTFGMDGRWEDSVSFFIKAIDQPLTSGWLVSGSLSDKAFDGSAHEMLDPLLLGSVLEATMDSCNQAKQFGVALFLLRLLELSLPAKALMKQKTTNKEAQNFLSMREIPATPAAKHRCADAIYPTICAVPNSASLLSSTMVSLCGLSMPADAVDLFRLVDDARPVDITDNSRDIYSFACSRSKGHSEMDNSQWNYAYRNLHRLTASLLAVRNDVQETSAEDLCLVSTLAAGTIEACNEVSQPAVGTLLSKLLNLDQKLPLPETSKIPVEAPLDAPTAVLTDQLLAAIMGSYSKHGQHEDALKLFDFVSAKDNPSVAEWLDSCGSALRSLFVLEREEEAMSLFNSIVSTARSPVLYNLVARELNNRKRAKEVLRLFAEASEVHCVSEDLCVEALKAIGTFQRQGDDDKALRNVIGYAASIAGRSSEEWLRSKYWTLKKHMGFGVISALMKWNDPKTRTFDELELAVELFEARSSSGLSPKLATLISIVSAASGFSPKSVPRSKRNVPRFPRDRESWMELLEQVMAEAEKTPLFSQPDFVDNGSRAYCTLGGYSEAVNFVNAYIARGLLPWTDTLNLVKEAAVRSETTHSIAEIEMLLEDSRKGPMR
jgi:hypothetical protein